MGSFGNPRGSRLAFLAHAFFCEDCDPIPMDRTYAGTAHVARPNQWKCCDVGDRLRDMAVCEYPDRDLPPKQKSE